MSQSADSTEYSTFTVVSSSNFQEEVLKEFSRLTSQDTKFLNQTAPFFHRSPTLGIFLCQKCKEIFSAKPKNVQRIEKYF